MAYDEHKVKCQKKSVVYVHASQGLELALVAIGTAIRAADRGPVEVALSLAGRLLCDKSHTYADANIHRWNPE